MRARRFSAALELGSLLPIHMRCPEPLERSPTLISMVATPVRLRVEKPIRPWAASRGATSRFRASSHDVAVRDDYVVEIEENISSADVDVVRAHPGPQRRRENTLHLVAY